LNRHKWLERFYLIVKRSNKSATKSQRRKDKEISIEVKFQTRHGTRMIRQKDGGRSARMYTDHAKGRCVLRRIGADKNIFY